MAHPVQEIIFDPDNVLRFRQNAIVRFLLDAGPFDMNRLGVIPFSDEDREQFAQLIGYSVSGFSKLPYVTDETWEKVDAARDVVIGAHTASKEVRT